jgi:hypothetical protein
MERRRRSGLPHNRQVDVLNDLIIEGAKQFFRRAKLQVPEK